MSERNRHIYCQDGKTLWVASLGERIRALRVAARKSQPALAAEVGISQPSLHNIESGKTRTIRGATLAGLCRALNVSPEVLLGSKRSVSQEQVLHEAEMMALWRSLSEENRSHVLAVSRALASKPGRPPAVTPAPPAPAKAAGRSRTATTAHGDLSDT